LTNILAVIWHLLCLTILWSMGISWLPFGISSWLLNNHASSLCHVVITLLSLVLEHPSPWLHHGHLPWHLNIVDFFVAAIRVHSVVVGGHNIGPFVFYPEPVSFSLLPSPGQYCSLSLAVGHSLLQFHLVSFLALSITCPCTSYLFSEALSCHWALYWLWPFHCLILGHLVVIISLSSAVVASYHGP